MRSAAHRLTWAAIVGGLALMPKLHAEALPAQAAEPLVLEKTIALHGVRGRIDHMAFDPGRKRLVVAELGNNSVDVIDVVAGVPLHRFTGLREPQGVGYAERSDVILIANAGDGSVLLFNAADFSPAGAVSLGNDADNVRIDPRNGLAVIGYGGGGLALIDPTAHAKVADIRLPAHPEGFQIDPATGRTYVNIPDARQIAVVDLDARRVTATWQTKDAHANFPMALDPSHSLLASVFRSPPVLLLQDIATGANARSSRSAATRTTCSSIHDALGSTSVAAPVSWQCWSTARRDGMRLIRSVPHPVRGRRCSSRNWIACSLPSAPDFWDPTRRLWCIGHCHDARCRLCDTGSDVSAGHRLALSLRAERSNLHPVTLPR